MTNGNVVQWFRLFGTILPPVRRSLRDLSERRWPYVQCSPVPRSSEFPENSSHLSLLFSSRQCASLTHLAATLMDLPATVANKRLTKNRGVRYPSHFGTRTLRCHGPSLFEVSRVLSPCSSLPCLAGSKGLKAGQLHRFLRFGILHEGVPNEAASVVFRHQHGNAEIDAQHVRVIPGRQGIEGVDEAVFLPHLIPVRPTESSQNPRAIIEEKRKGATCRARHDAPIDRSLRRWTTPRRVALHVIRSADSPKVLAVVGKAVAQR